MKSGDIALLKAVQTFYEPNQNHQAIFTSGIKFLLFLYNAPQNVECVNTDICVLRKHYCQKIEKMLLINRLGLKSYPRRLMQQNFTF